MADLKMVEGIEIGLKDMIEVINNNNEKVKESNRLVIALIYYCNLKCKLK